MNLLIENGVLEEIECGTNFAYVLKDNSFFLSTEYKVLQSQSNGVFAQCMKMLYNGKLELYYLVNGLKPLSLMLPSIDADHFATVVKSLLQGVINVKNNGFLSCNNIDGSFEHIYVDPNTFQVRLVYVPINQHEHIDSSAFENALRTDLIRTVSETSTLSSPKMEQLVSDLQNGILSIEQICSKMGGKDIPVTTPGGKTPPEGGVMKLIAMNAPTRVEFQITKPEYMIGKKDINDGIVSFNKMVSRIHCKITQNDKQYSICDLNSANGTYLNGLKLQPNQAFPLENGDIVRLANSDFQVVIE